MDGGESGLQRGHGEHYSGRVAAGNLLQLIPQLIDALRLPDPPESARPVFRIRPRKVEEHVERPRPAQAQDLIAQQRPGIIEEVGEVRDGAHRRLFFRARPARSLEQGLCWRPIRLPVNEPEQWA